MASLNDIETRIQNIIDIIESRVISTITGVLPLTFRADGSALMNYRIYGTANGAGVQTENLFDKTQYAMVPVDNQGATRCGIAIPITDGTYTLCFSKNSTRSLYIHTMLNGRVTGSENVTRLSPYTFTLSDVDTLIIRSSFTELIPWDETGYTNIMLTEGSTTPETYIPYGYKLPLTITSGEGSKTADVYIGDSKLMAGDYIDYESGKIVRNGTPQDPPEPFPEIDTYIGINTLDSVETLGEVTIKGKIKEVI